MTKREKEIWYPAYREVVYEWLMFYYGIPKPSARAITSAWWRRLRQCGAFDSGLFLHAEPCNVAQDLIGKGPCSKDWDTEKDKVFTTEEFAEYERLNKFYLEKFKKRFKKKRTSGIIR